MFKRIPTYNNGNWEYTEFETRQEFVDFLWTCFKEPGKYNFDETSLLFNEHARHFDKHGAFTLIPAATNDYYKFYDTEKEKSVEGVIFKGKETWYLPRDYYFLINFLKIYNKGKKDYTFADIRDAQYHMALYECRAEYSKKHASILKKRQILSTYQHAAKIINRYWFDAGFITKIGASLEDYINNKGLWNYLTEYRNFLNTHTPWYRNSQPNEELNWEQKLEMKSGGRTRYIGLKSKILGYTLDKKPTSGVGGPTGLFYHEEAGVAPKMNQTLEYLLPALKEGLEYTGMFIAAGSVGDLKQCEPLKGLIFRPESKDVLGVRTDLLDENGQVGICGLFIPEQWSMPPYIDKYGNSLVEEALEAIKEQRKIWEKELNPNDYQHRISQHPINIKEAFAYREESIFRQDLISQQIERLEKKEYFIEYIDLERQQDNKIQAKPTKALPILEFPFSMRAENKEGAIMVHERPIENPPWGLYFASIDPVSAGKTKTSNSLCTIIVYKRKMELTINKSDGSIEHQITNEKIVCSWSGRFDDINKTHERLSLIIEWYGAWTIIENNVSLFIQYMMLKKRQKYLVPKNQIQFLKELQANENVFQEYGWRNAAGIFKDNILNYGIEFIQEEIDTIVDVDGEIKKVIYGVERITDIMLLKEMQAYNDNINVDRVVAYCALAAFVKLQDAVRGLPKTVEHEEKINDKSKLISKFNPNPFNNFGGNKFNKDLHIKKQPFKTLR